MNEAIFDLNFLQEGVQLEVKRAQGSDGRGELPKDFKSLWDTLNNQQKVSKNILRTEDVTVKLWSNKKIIQIHIPRANRKDRPVYLGENPLKGTYRRNHEGDYLVDEVTVRRMLADQTEDAPDSKILSKFGLSDLDLDSFKFYRNQFASLRSDHPFLTGSEKDFLSKLGGWSKNRETGEDGLTLAGLLMFGKYNSIREVCPNYFVDYQERPVDGSNRWLDRIEPDGTWSGNLYDFYRRVILKLYEGLKVPFALKNETRVDQTPVHEALREALVNTLIHADFSGRASVLIVKNQGMFSFRNPGLMRISIDDAIHGGITDARNRSLQNMFKLVGAGEQAGSGVPKIFGAWKDQHWPEPLFAERQEAPETTILELKMVKTVTLSSQHLPTEVPTFADSSQHLPTEVPTFESKAPNIGKSGFEGNASNEVDLKPGGKRWQEVEAIACQINKTKKSPKVKVQEVIAAILGLGFITIKDLAGAIHRDPVSVQNHYLKNMVQRGDIELKYPDRINHPQAYRKKGKKQGS